MESERSSPTQQSLSQETIRLPSSAPWPARPHSDPGGPPRPPAAAGASREGSGTGSMSHRGAESCVSAPAELRVQPSFTPHWVTVQVGDQLFPLTLLMAQVMLIRLQRNRHRQSGSRCPRPRGGGLRQRTGMVRRQRRPP